VSLRLYRYPLSGHSHRVELLCALLGLPLEQVEVDLRKGEHRSAAFLALNPFGQVPVLQDGDVRLADSNAILVYLAMRYDPGRRWYPQDPVRAAEVQRWLSVAAGELMHGPAAARRAVVFRGSSDPEAIERAGKLLSLLDRHLADRAFLVGAEPTLADVAVYTYTAHAPEGGVLLEPFPAVRAWLSRVEALPGFVPMQRASHV
jgi:glutathione S-transferase